MILHHYQQLTDNQATLALWYIVNASLVSYYKLINYFGEAKNALLADLSRWQSLSLHASHIKRWYDIADVMAFLEKVDQELQAGLYGLIFENDPDYPKQLSKIYDPPPVLFFRGNIKRLSQRQIAIVGSRNPTQHAEKITFDLAQYLVQSGYVVTSGLAQGVDKQAHLGAMAQIPALFGMTVGVMGTGIDVCYPKNHNALFLQIIKNGGCLITELLPATPASKHTFPRRNRLVAGLSLATVVTEAALQSGSLITAKLSAEQGKQVFALPSQIDNKQAEGCHHLIREGATLIYHPDQILEDLKNQDLQFYNALPKNFSQGVSVFGDDDEKVAKNLPKSTPNTKKSTYKLNGELLPKSVLAEDKFIPKHLVEVYQFIHGEPKELDVVVENTGMAVSELLALLMELELLGLVKKLGGCYVRC